LLSRRDTADALAIWRELLLHWAPRDEFDLHQTYSHRLAAVAAARLQKWSEAADWLRTARSLGDEANQATYCAGLLVDEGYAHWKAGDNPRAFACLVQGLNGIDRLPVDDVDEKAGLLRKRAAATITWIAATATGTPPNGFPEPPPGWCSSPDTVKEAEASSIPSDAVWARIVEFEFIAALGDEQFRAHEAHLKSSRFGLIRFSFDRLRLQRHLRSLALDDFVDAVGDCARSFALSQRVVR